MLSASYTTTGDTTQRLITLNTTAKKFLEADPRATNAIAKLLNEAVKLGYRWGKIEADQKLKPLAQASLDLKAKGREVGFKRGRQLSNQADEQWRNRAREFVVSLLHRNSKVSKAHCVRELRGKLEKDGQPKGNVNNWPPSDKIIARLVDGVFLANRNAGSSK